MKDPMLRLLMDSIDDDLLEEAQRPLPARRPALRWGALAACLCLTGALLLAHPRQSGPSDTAVRASDSSAAESAAPLCAALTLPEDAVQVSDYDLRRDDAGAVTAVSCTVSVDGTDFCYSAAYAAEEKPAGSALLAWELEGVTLLLYGDSVSWFDSASGVEWSLSGGDSETVLNAAAGIMETQSLAVPAAPEGAEDVFYMAFPLEDMTVMEVSFTLDGVRWHYRMAPSGDVSEAIPDISEFAGGTQTASGSLRWCPTELRWDDGGAGCVIWRDIAPGIVYSLTADSGADETMLAAMAQRVFVPAQGEDG